jgi:hypothetical protein
MPINLLIVGPFLPDHYCNPLELAICTRAVLSWSSSAIPAFDSQALGRCSASDRPSLSWGRRAAVPSIYSYNQYPGVACGQSIPRCLVAGSASVRRFPFLCVSEPRPHLHIWLQQRPDKIMLPGTGLPPYIWIASRRYVMRSNVLLNTQLKISRAT